MSDAPLPFLADPRLARVLDALNGAGEETRVVGGAVRNALLGLPVSDMDLATTALPTETIRRAEAAGLKAVPTGLAHGTVTVVTEGTPFEVTTLREDVETDGRHAVVRFGRDWARDAARRDFTMNALFATRTGEVIDLVGGRADLDARTVRFIGVPEQRIREDYLRILRLFRFHAAYGAGELDPPALSAAIRCRAGLAGLSRERVGAEMLKLLAAGRAATVLRDMSDAGLLVPVLGGVPALGALERLVEIERDLGRSPDVVLRLGALAVRVTEDADRLQARLRLSKTAHQRLARAAQPGMSGPVPERALRVLLYEVGADGVVDRALLAAARDAGPVSRASLRELVAAAERWNEPVFPVRARHLQALGLEPGRVLGEALARAKQAWIAADFPEGEAVALDLARQAVAGADHTP
ncbi:CCA tRNA nucleotidyltransferase [Aquabacter cavernae]|uniref:CCA tRNA nucleotidyltransferase n=1 Tax=Aquabacter cavernae TaxID=2496029 RepID=UPI000F8E205B|nr:CCA tRNA nucleotidyltransferase [Aquabacter cavernae]